MLLGFFTEEAYDKLLSAIPDNTKRYNSDKEWLPAFFNGIEYCKQSSVDVGMFKPSYVPGAKNDTQKSQEDLVNTRLIYDAFKSLTPLQASNKYMWTYLCHAIPEYSAYIRDRWLTDPRENTIKNRFFVTTSGSLLNDNALSRLWWYGYLTYDPQNSNPFALTEILLTNQTVCTDIMDTYNRMNPTRMRGILTAIKDFKNELALGESITDYVRECNKYLNRYAAVSSFEFLESEEIRDIAFNYLMQIRKSKN